MLVFSPRFLCWNPSSYVMVLGGGAFGRWLGFSEVVRMGPSWLGLVPSPIAGDLLPSLCLNSVRSQPSATRKSVFTRTLPCWCPHLGLSFQNCKEQIFDLYKPHYLWCFVTAAWTWGTGEALWGQNFLASQWKDVLSQVQQTCMYGMLCRPCHLCHNQSAVSMQWESNQTLCKQNVPASVPRKLYL